MFKHIQAEQPSDICCHYAQHWIHTDALGRRGLLLGTAHVTAESDWSQVFLRVAAPPYLMDQELQS